LRARVAAEAKQKMQAQSKINLESITAIWNEYRANNTSTSTKSAMGQAILDFMEKKIMIKVPTAATKNIILQETPLMEQLRDSFGMTDLMMEINIDLTHFPEYEETKSVVIKSQKEVFEDFVQKNPNILQLMEKLDLKLD
jgi:hypothetical protein